MDKSPDGPVEYLHCERCGATIAYAVRHERVYLLHVYRHPACEPMAEPEIAFVTSYGGDVRCECGHEQSWYASQAAIDRLVERVLRQRDYNDPIKFQEESNGGI